MFVTMSEFHPMYDAEWVNAMSDTTVYLIKITRNNEVFYLAGHDINTNVASWTTKFMKAHHFLQREHAVEFIASYLPSRDCEVYHQAAMWVI